MGAPEIWRKSSYSGPGDGDSCVEIALRPARVAIRDSRCLTGTLSRSPTPRSPLSSQA
ncbi:DUF397 domain-containing protein [Streptomyces thermocarboxydus]